MPIRTSQKSKRAAADTGVIVVGGGTGTRMGGIDKVFAPIGGRPLLLYSVDAFHACERVRCIVLVLSERNLQRGRELVEESRLAKVVAVVPGGARRQDSVRVGLDALLAAPGPPDALTWVAVHDAARPFVDEAMLERGIEAAAATGAAVAAIPATDTIKAVDANRLVVDTPDRSRLWAVQTPQVFRPALLARAHGEITGDVTDDAAMVELAGGRVAVFDGSPDNIKITRPEDLAVAEAIASRRGSAVAGPAPAGARWGIGFDGHALGPGRPLRLGGVTIPFEMGLIGHSDGDVLLHAVADALLGAAGLGDLGRHFPSSGPAYAGIDSSVLLQRVLDMLQERGWGVEHVDATIIAQRPRLSPFQAEMTASIASLLGLDSASVNVKVTSTDRVGAIGKGEGIAAQAVATIRRR